MSFHQRTIMAGELRIEHIGQRIVLKGWVDGHRDFGGMLFIDIRDRSGKAQCVVSKETQGLTKSFSVEHSARKRKFPSIALRHVSRILNCPKTHEKRFATH